MRLLLLIALFALALGAGPAMAQPFLQPGAVVSGRLDTGDQVLSSGEYVDVGRFNGRAGETYTLTLSSGDFDAYLVVRGPDGLSEENDDHPFVRGSTDSRISFTLTRGGEVRVSATSFSPGETGRYTLLLEEGHAAAGFEAANARAAAAAGAAPIAVGESREGRLEEADARLSSGEAFDTHTLEGRRGQQLDLRLSSTEFDPYLIISGPDGFSAFNDDDADAPDSLDSRLIVTLRADGAYTITATSYEPGERGRYRLSVTDGAGYQAPSRPTFEAREPAPAGGGVIQVGQSVGGLLQTGDATLRSGEYVDNYRFMGRRGDRVAIELTSSAFDAYLLLTSPSGALTSNDDGAEGTDSLLETVLTEDGEYTIGVTSFRPGETGSYRLSLEPSLGSPRQAAVQGGPRVFAIMVEFPTMTGSPATCPIPTRTP